MSKKKKIIKKKEQRELIQATFLEKNRDKTKGRGLKIKVVGVGGAGCSAIGRMIKFRIPNIEFIAINTDSQSLAHASAHKKIRIGRSLTKGLGTGMDPVIGQQAAEDGRKEIVESLRGADLIFLIAGLGGGTGSGALPVIADLIHDIGTLSIALVTKPFVFEGPRRMSIAEQGLKMLAPKVDTLISIANERILQVIDRKTPLLEAFGVVDNVLKQAIQGITEIVNFSGVVNVDLADLKTVLRGAGPALLGFGQAEGDNRATQAVRAALDNSLLDLSIKGAKGVVFIVTGGADLTMYEINEAAQFIADLADPDCQLIFGVVVDPTMNGKIKITIIATGLSQEVVETVTGVISIKPQPMFEKMVEVEKINQPQKMGSEIKIKKINKSEKIVTEDELEIPAFLRKK